jgi:hypothetical protein
MYSCFIPDDMPTIEPMVHGLALAPASPAFRLPEPPAPAATKPWRGPILNRSALHGPAGEIASAIEPYSESEGTAILAQLLAVCGNVLGRGPHIQIQTSRHYLNLYVALVGSTASRKGSSFQPVRALIAAADPKWAGAHIGSGLVSGAGLIQKLQTLPPDDHRFFLLEEELGQVLKRGHHHSGALREGWDGRSLALLRSKRAVEITDPHLSVVGHVTPEELRSSLRAVDRVNGLANRFLWIDTDRIKALPSGGNLPPEVFAYLLEILTKALERGSRVGAITRSPEADAVWTNKYLHYFSREPSDFNAVVARAEAQIARLAALYAALDGSAMIEVKHELAAEAFWDFSEESARRAFSEPSAVEGRILRALETAKELTRSDIRALVGTHVKAEEIEAVRTRLTSCHRVTVDNRSTAGRSQEVWYLGEAA